MCESVEEHSSQPTPRVLVPNTFGVSDALEKPKHQRSRPKFPWGRKTTHEKPERHFQECPMRPSNIEERNKGEASLRNFKCPDT